MMKRCRNISKYQRRLACPRRVVNPVRRRGVASILAMMFLVIFASLAAVMAIVAQGNLRTAYSHLQVNRAMSAAETGLVFGMRRLTKTSSRFVIESGLIDADLGDKLWNGTWGAADGEVQILPADYDENPSATSVSEAIMYAHTADLHNLIMEPGDELLPATDEFGKIIVQPIGLYQTTDTPTFQLSYEPLADGSMIRITSVGRDGDLRRTIKMDFQLVKRLDAAIISPNRIMIGKNVHIEGPIGTRYGETVADLAVENGHPIVLRSDFLDLDAVLDTQIYALIDSIADYDVDLDNRLRPGHAAESAGLSQPYMVDYNGDGYVDDYDLWLAFFDANGDYQIDIATEFTGIDDQLVTMIDGQNADRNGDGLVDASDTSLGYQDGFINDYDFYAKISGRLLFKASRADWESGQGNTPYQQMVTGPIRPDTETAATMFAVDETELYDLTLADFSNSQTALRNAALSGLTFEQQVTAQLGGAPGSHVWSDDPTNPDYLSYENGIWETMPYNSPGFYDWYQRPIYKNMTFVNVMAPINNAPSMGLPKYANGLFINCTFIGACYVETTVANDHINWNYLGMKVESGGEYVDKYDYTAWEPVLQISGEDIFNTKDFSNNLRFADCTFIGAVVSDPLTEFTHVRNKLQFTGNTRFTLDVNEIDDTNLNATEKQQAKDAFAALYDEIIRSSLLVPNFSVDVGNFTNAAERVELQGTIVAGVMDVRGSADIEGTLLMTYRPVEGEGPLHYGGKVSDFNTTIGYFGPDDGDGEGSDPSPEVGYGNITIRYNPDIPIPDGIMGPIKVDAVRGTYTEGGSL